MSSAGASASAGTGRAEAGRSAAIAAIDAAAKAVADTHEAAQLQLASDRLRGAAISSGVGDVPEVVASAARVAAEALADAKKSWRSARAVAAADCRNVRRANRRTRKVQRHRRLRRIIILDTGDLSGAYALLHVRAEAAAATRTAKKSTADAVTALKAVTDTSARAAAVNVAANCVNDLIRLLDALQGQPSALWAGQLLAAAVRLLPAADRVRYAEEFRNELWELTTSGAGWWRQLRYSGSQLTRAVPLSFAVRTPSLRLNRLMAVALSVAGVLGATSVILGIYLAGWGMPSQPSSPPLSARAEVAAIGELLNRYMPDNSMVASAVIMAESCQRVNPAATSIGVAHGQSQTEYMQARALPVVALPGGITLKSALLREIQYQVQLDQKYVSFAESQQYPFCNRAATPGARQDERKEADSVRDLARIWTLFSIQYGLPALNQW